MEKPQEPLPATSTPPSETPLSGRYRPLEQTEEAFLKGCARARELIAHGRMKPSWPPPEKDKPGAPAPVATVPPAQPGVSATVTKHMVTTPFVAPHEAAAARAGAKIPLSQDDFQMIVADSGAAYANRHVVVVGDRGRRARQSSPSAKTVEPTAPAPPDSSVTPTTMPAPPADSLDESRNPKRVAILDGGPGAPYDPFGKSPHRPYLVLMKDPPT